MSSFESVLIEWVYRLPQIINEVTLGSRYHHYTRRKKMARRHEQIWLSFMGKPMEEKKLPFHAKNRTIYRDKK